jgi:hypothetical protein
LYELGHTLGLHKLRPELRGPGLERRVHGRMHAVLRARPYEYYATITAYSRFRSSGPKILK